MSMCGCGQDARFTHVCSIQPPIIIGPGFIWPNPHPWWCGTVYGPREQATYCPDTITRCTPFCDEDCNP